MFFTTAARSFAVILSYVKICAYKMCACDTYGPNLCTRGSFVHKIHVTHHHVNFLDKYVEFHDMT